VLSALACVQTRAPEWRSPARLLRTNTGRAAHETLAAAFSGQNARSSAAITDDRSSSEASVTPGPADTLGSQPTRKRGSPRVGRRVRGAPARRSSARRSTPASSPVTIPSPARSLDVKSGRFRSPAAAGSCVEPSGAALCRCARSERPWVARSRRNHWTCVWLWKNPDGDSVVGADVKVDTARNFVMTVTIERRPK
jgi:hypothetical protein